MTTPTATEQNVIRADARQRLTELRAVARTLWPDRDDASVGSELSSVLSAMRVCEAVLHTELTDTPRASA